MKRRHFIATAAATLATPQILNAAQNDSFELMEHLRPKEVRVQKKLGFEPGQIVVTTQAYYLYHMQDERNAIRYGVAVGKEGLNFSGDAVIQRKVEWPSWTPTKEMIERNPGYARFADGMPGGPNNPLGSRALYLYQDNRDTLFRIHGTNVPKSIGTPSSNGCIRMLNAHVEHLYNVIPLGTKVTVI
ncbi:L,D-transpeptidase [Shimia abyssi]|uniref:L,D-transpeptidase-like protein n=1 Tax=Shimia abyssi TaxID=1662395 RepID=A0A2P8F4B5_9RHOB|nr:L,D-transpeptidase [Shimia abyssi]PSL16557.1 L,D-transpeptidase-like protein [Shimia abyssi]